MWSPWWYRLLILLQFKPGAEFALLFDGFARREIIQLEERADFYFTLLAWIGRGGAPAPFDGLFLGADLQDPVAGDQFLGFREGPVDNGPAGTRCREPDACALGAGLEPGGIESTPDFMSSSLYLPIAATRSSPGMTPASEPLLAFTMIMTRIVVVFLSVGSSAASAGCTRAWAAAAAASAAAANASVGGRIVGDFSF